MRKALCCFLLCVMVTACGRSQLFQPTTFREIDGWNEAAHEEGLNVLRASCKKGSVPRKAAGYEWDEGRWSEICYGAEHAASARHFFETYFEPVQVVKQSMLTGYYAPELMGSFARTARFDVPIYGVPDPREQQKSRQVIETYGLHTPPIAYTDDSVALFFMQVQGSGWMRTPEGKRYRLAYAGNNGHEYQSIGKLMLAEGIFEKPEDVSADAIKAWLYTNPEDGAKLMHKNPRYIYFRLDDTSQGVVGAEGTVLSVGHSIAIDPEFTDYGAPIWLHGVWPDGRAITRVVVAQDTGSAIKGRTRADLFLGTGDDAGSMAGEMRHPLLMTILVPR